MKKSAVAPPSPPDGSARIRAALIFNPVAGAGDAEADLKRIRSILEPVYELEVMRTEEDLSATDLSSKALQERHTRIFVAGGDGTVAGAAQVLTGSTAVLGIIPRGTANALAVSLFGPSLHLDPIGLACRTLASGSVRVIDTAICNGKPMLLLAGVGWESGMVRGASRQAKNHLGPIAYVTAGLEEVNTRDPFHVRIVCDGTEHEFQACSVVVANAAPGTSIFAQGGGAPVFDDGLLDLTVVPDPGGMFDLARSVGGLIRSGLTRSEAGGSVGHFKGRIIRVDTEPRQSVVIDGEAAGKTPLSIEVLPASLRVIAPRAG